MSLHLGPVTGATVPSSLSSGKHLGVSPCPSLSSASFSARDLHTDTALSPDCAAAGSLPGVLSAALSPAPAPPPSPPEARPVFAASATLMLEGHLTDPNSWARAGPGRGPTEAHVVGETSP